ncbi:MAG: zinc ribbon domain-containing protein, partial [Oscillospiraceae bacterium]|nr:zinc ribbon domain-containing protein [Oscillospiraceae bacterium]
MRCQNCGIEIDTRQESSDGTIVCPGCGTIYRKKAAVKNERKEYKPFNSSDPDSPHSSFWKWQIVAASILVIAIIAAGFFGVNRLLSDARKRRDLLTEPSPTAMQVPAASPTATPTPTPRPTPTPTQTPAPTPTRTPTPTPFPTYAAQTNYTYPTATPYNAAYPPIYATSTPYPYSYSYPTATPYYYYPTPTPTPAPTPTPITEVFLRELLNNGTPIQGYNWQNTALDSSDGTTRQVAFTDVTGDGVPELLYLRTAQNGNPHAEIRIGTYSNGSYREIYRFDQLDDRTGTHPYCFFQLKGDSALYAYLNDPNPYNNAKLFKLSTQSNGTFDGSYLMGMTASASSTQYNTMYGNCSEADFNGVLAQLRQNMDKVV